MRTKSFVYVAICLFSFLSTNAQNWDEVIKAVASDRDAGDLFGVSVAISGDYAIVSAVSDTEDAIGGNFREKAGSAYIFKNNGGAWTVVQKIVASDRSIGSQFGTAVAISEEYAIVGAIKEDEDDTGGSTLANA
ncbi:MAG: hypothetical protein RLZZ337_1265 [Bacteroidota bacterium]|jgi:hypothetical protein